jgi:N-carbamoyl-L-amino-acid hydrolase
MKSRDMQKMNRREFNVMFVTMGSVLAQRNPISDSVRVNGTRLNDLLKELSQFGRNPQGGVSRVAYSDADLKARAFASSLMGDAKLEVTVDYAGNLIGRRAGSGSGLKPLVIGSHIDSVPEAGNYDGNVGSMAAIEVARTLAEKAVTLRHPLEVIIFQNEEGGTVGSRAIASGLTERDLQIISNSGRSIREGISLIGGAPDRLAASIRRKGDIAAYVELHIEQGAVLFKQNIRIGVVEGIVSIERYSAVVTGFANHAGATMMADRQDALVAASQLTLAVREAVTARPGKQVGTVGQLNVEPNAPNVIPGVVRMTIEVRDLSSATLSAVMTDIRRRAAAIATQSKTTIEITELSRNPPALAEEGVQRAIERAARTMGLSTRRQPSFAGHDAQMMAVLGPMGMIFVPSVGGISHSPRELTTWDDCANGANVLLAAVLAVDRT